MTLRRHTPLGPRPPPGFLALDRVRDAPMAEMASPSRDEPAPGSTPSAPASLSLDPAGMALGIMAHINGMVDLMLMGPLAEYCQEEVRELLQRFTVQIRPK